MTRLDVETWPIERVVPYARNPRRVPDEAVSKVAASIREFGWRQPIVVDPDGVVIVGHVRLLAAQRLGLTEVPVHVARDLTPAQAKAYRIADNRVAEATTWDDALLALEFEDLASMDVDLALTGFDPSVFDPVLCELAYRWFCPPGGVVLDPFAGGSVRGIVAAMLGRRYVGVDLSEAQVAANREQAEDILGDAYEHPVWHVADARDLPTVAKGVRADLLFTCPPYADLEVYSDDPRDLSTMAYPDFVDAYRDVIAKACAMLRDDRFAVWVVGEARDRDGNCYGLVADTVMAFRDAGLHLYNDAVYVTPAGSVPVRTARQFVSARKLGRCHQYVLVFAKGDWRKAVEACGPAEHGDVEHEEPDEAAEREG